MSRPRKIYTDKERQRKHEASLARRRAKHTEALKLKAATEVAEGEADFETLVEAEKARLGAAEKQQSKAAKHSPKRIAAARENLSLAFDLMGGVPALVVWGRQNPTEFYRLWARLIPKESVEVSAQLPLEALLAKLAGRESSSVQEAAWQVGTELLEHARHRVIEHDAQNPDAQNPYDVEDEETLQ